MGSEPKGKEPIAMMWSLFFAIILFAISIISVVLENLALPIPFLSILPTLINSSSGPLSVMCIIGMIATFRKYKGNMTSAGLPIVFYVLDLTVINKLYLNATWHMIAKWFLARFATMESWNWPMIVITAFCLAVAVAMLIWGIQIWKKEAVKKRGQVKQTSKDQRMASESELDPYATQPDGDGRPDSSRPPVEDSSDPTPREGSANAPTNDRSEGPPFLAYGIVCMLLVIPAVASIQYVLYRVSPLKLTAPKFGSEILDILLYLSTICVGLVVALLLWIAKKHEHSQEKRPLRHPAVLAIILEIPLLSWLFFSKGSLSEELLSSFLNSIANNNLAALIFIPIVLFVILDVGISLFMNIFFENFSNKAENWQKEAHDKLAEIQRYIVIFALNIFFGILRLLWLIPDFFNEIGNLLLSQDNLFPKIDERRDEDPPPSKTS